jgi:hypothetical protein
MFNKKLSPNDFVARGKMETDNISIPVIVHGTYSSYEPTPISCTISPDGRRKTLGHISNFDKIEIKAITNEGEEIRILGLQQVTTSYKDSKTTWKGIANYFIKGQLKTFSATGSEIHCSIFIPYTPLASAEASYVNSFDGTITLDENSKREGVKWKTPLGQAELIDNYDYVEDKIGIDKATIRIRRCQACLIIKPKGKFSLENLMKELPDSFDETFRLVSFLSRKRITWYSAEVMAFPGKGKSNFRQANAYRQSWLGFQRDQRNEQSWIDMVVKLTDLRSGLFEKLHENYQASQYKTIIGRTIPFLMMSYEQGYFESHIANTYSALETMVAGLSSDGDEETGNSLTSTEFMHLTRKIKTVIHAEISDEKIREGITRKLGELNRRPILDRLMALLRKYKVPIEKIWSPNTDIVSELGKIIKRRNLYIHQGRIDDFGQYYDDYSRLRILVELWILKLLECPDDSINDVSLRMFLRR